MPPHRKILIPLPMTGILFSAAVAQTPFATTVVEYAPAPGQWVNDANLNDQTAALGRPYAGGSDAPGHSSLVTLGGFGGYITLKFDHVVEDHALNPFGMDAIVFGNAFWVTNDPQRHWAECGTIEIALDADGNGRINEDEEWYLVPGSHMADPTVQYAERTWDDDPHTTIPPMYVSWIPSGHSGLWITSAYELPPAVFGQAVIVNPSADSLGEGIYGYADYSPTLLLGDMNADNQVDDPLITAEDFYTVPDDPLTVGITLGSGGGDAIDIAWAIDPQTGRPAGLTGFDFIRITNPTDVVMPLFNEKSPEIDAVADVAPDPCGDCDEDGDIDLADAQCLQVCFEQTITGQNGCVLLDRDHDAFINEVDALSLISRLTGPR